MFATKREGVLVAGSVMVNTGIYALVVRFVIGTVGIGIRELRVRFAASW